MRRFIACTTASTILCCSALAPAAAATLSTVTGKVLVNSGSGYAPRQDGAHLKTGDTVIANPGSSALIVYDDGCKMSVKAGTVVTVENGCPGLGVVAAETGLGASSATYVVVGGLAIAGAVGVVAATSSNSDRPASP